MRAPFVDGPSKQARAFLSNPANRVADAPLTAEVLQLERAETRQLAERAAPRICKQHQVEIDWCDIEGRKCLVILPKVRLHETKILYLFGGGFVSGGPLEDLSICAQLADKTGQTVVAPSYSLAPENPFPAALEDAKSVAADMACKGPIQIAGESAGGNLALCVVQWLISGDFANPSALALLSPAADLSPAFDPDMAPDDPTLSPQRVRMVPSVYCPDADRMDPKISPVYGCFASWPDTIITTGTRDRFLGQCARLARAIQAKGGSVDLRVWDGLWHVFEYYPDIPEAAASLAEVAAFLSRSAGPRS